jgi:hypothetical protein
MLALYEPRNSGAVGTIKSLVCGLVGFSILAILVHFREGMWLAVAVPYFAFLVGLNSMDLTGMQEDALFPRSCLVPSAVFTVAFHMSVWRLPLISIDLYRTMVNPFLEFSASIKQYDFWLFFYLVVALVGFLALEDAFHDEDSSDRKDCPILRDHDNKECFGMAAAWSFGEEGDGERVQPKICFVPNRDVYDPASKVQVYLWPAVWLYVELAVSTLATVMFSWFAYRRLVAGTSESIAARLRIIVVNFRNIFMQLSWIGVIGVLDVLTYAQSSEPTSEPMILLWPNILVYCIFSRWVFFSSLAHATVIPA